MVRKVIEPELIDRGQNRKHAEIITRRLIELPAFDHGVIHRLMARTGKLVLRGSDLQKRGQVNRHAPPE